MSRDEEDKKIIESAHRIKSKFKSEVLTDKDEEEMSFLDDLDSHVKDLLGDESSDIYTVMDKEKLEKWKKQRKSFTGTLKRKLRTLASPWGFSAFLLAVIVIFLISEAAQFYALDGNITFYALWQAALTELAFIFLNGFRSSTKIQKFFVGGLRIGLFTLMTFVISSSAIRHGTNVGSEIDNIAQQITVLERQIEEKQKEMEYYISINWPRNATQARIERERLVERLLELKERQISEERNEAVSSLVLYETYGQAAFRIILLLLSAVIARRLFRF
jgi:hypothetical protein